MAERPPKLTAWLDFIGTLDCTCEYRFTSLGTLHGISMGNGWVRTTTNPTCPIHPQKGKDR